MCDAVKNIVVLTGAGISAESGLATFRSSDGLWENHRVEDVATPEGYMRDPQLVHNFYNARRRQLFDPSVQPNAAHLALTKLQNASHVSLTLITQNVDNLHERAGATTLHMHGELLKMYCSSCDSVFDWREDCSPDVACPKCGALRALRPDIVWFGEIPYFLDQASEALQHADIFAAIGTSGVVYPAAGFAQLAKEAGALCVEINLAPSGSAARFDQGYYGKAGVQVPRWVEAVLA
ncbi:NAD-dependent protein deacylase [Cardiobacteriaceae bacterium TAE3-ERU3]|nr:NAD-dependent protein deacylase [Cardiobacteriaceae bacterium TAE3-ERU3]